MKKLLSLFLIGCLLLALPFVMAGGVAAEEDVNLRIGVISDVHVAGWTPDKPQAKWFEEVLMDYRTRGVDIILIAGDLTQGFCDTLTEAEEQFAEFASVWKKVFPNGKNPDTGEDVAHLFIYGNHDADLDTNERTKNYWQKHMNEPYSPVVVREVKGYQFVAAHWGHEDEIADAIKAAAEKADGKPFFYMQHIHPQDTCYGSDEWGDEGVAAKVLKDYPNVVVFSGHSHFPLTDERNIHQGDFTSIGTASIHYVELETGKQGGTRPENYTNMKQGMYITVSDSKVDIERYNFYYKEVIGENWVLDLPLTKETFRYTDARYDSAVAPAFPESAKVSATNIGKNSVAVTFDAAVLDATNDILHSYVAEAVNTETGKVDGTTAIFTEFFLGAGRLGDSYTLSVKDLKPNTKYTLNVYALDSFQKRSEPISMTFTTMQDLSAGLDKFVPDVLDVVFTSGKYLDRSVYATQTQLMGDASLQKDDALGVTLLHLDGDGDYLNCFLSADQYEAMRDGVTVEILFRAKDVSRNSALISCTQSAGFGFELTGNGTADLWLSTPNGYFEGPSGRLETAVQRDVFHHLLFTYGSGRVAVYLDGKEVEKAGMVNGTQLVFNEAVALALGADPDLNGYGSLFLDGQIAMARVYSHATDASDMEKLYANAMSVLSPLVLYNKNQGTLRVTSDKAGENVLSSWKAGDKVYLFADAKEGYYVSSLTVDGVEVANGSLVELDDSQKVVKVTYEKGEKPQADNGGDGLVWIFVGGGVLLLAAAAVVFLLILKKKQ